jgi:hypothetical protein
MFYEVRDPNPNPNPNQIILLIAKMLQKSYFLQPEDRHAHHTNRFSGVNTAQCGNALYITDVYVGGGGGGGDAKQSGLLLRLR